MSDEAAFLTLPLTATGELEPEAGSISGVFGGLPEILEETLGIILDSGIKVSAPKMASFSKDELVSAIDAESTCLIHTSFTKGIEGDTLFLAKKETAKAFVEVVLGAPIDGDDEDLSEDSLDAYLELVNQIYGKVNLSFSEASGSTVSTGPFTLFDRESQDLADVVPDGNSFCAELGVSVAEKFDAAFLFIYSDTSVEQLAAAGDASSEFSLDDIIAEAQAENAATAGPPPPAPAPTVTAEMDDRMKAIMDMEMPVRVRFGGTQMYIRELLQLGAGSIIELNKSVDTPVDLVVNEDLVIARGEVVVVDSNFAIRITEVKSKAERIKGLG
ncbi:MAG: FliM/FliN family flagellar motor switch protein [Candidatus Coatesbacteria bacterium]|nr:FliM/FliN family flagellar motor switch protein [Candidatus Coatesbacteria bacterium]